MGGDDSQVPRLRYVRFIHHFPPVLGCVIVHPRRVSPTLSDIANDSINRLSLSPVTRFF